MRHSLCLLFPFLAMTDCASGETPADVLEKAPSKFAKSGDLKVHYKSLGEGKAALVFVHGWCCDHTVWRDQAAAFNGKVRMLFVDLPGYGKSDKPKIDYTMDVFAKGVDAILRDAGVEQAVLAGHSMGTPVVRQFYRLYPDKTKALIFVDGTLRPIAKDMAQAEQYASMFKEDTFKDAAPAFLASMFPKDTPVAFRTQIETLVKNANPSVAVSSWRGMFLDERIWKDNPVKAPALAIMARSPLWPEDYKSFVRKLVPDLDYREFDGVGHFLFMEKPKEINAALSEFLTRQGLLK